MRTLPFALLLLPSAALADVASSTPTETGATSDPCADKAEGDACTMDDGMSGTCDADGACVADDGGGGCSTAGTPIAAGGVTLLSLGLLGLRRKR